MGDFQRDLSLVNFHETIHLVAQAWAISNEKDEFRMHVIWAQLKRW